MPTKQQQEEINKAQLATVGETPETLESVIAEIKQELDTASKPSDVPA